MVEPSLNAKNLQVVADMDLRVKCISNTFFLKKIILPSVLEVGAWSGMG
jgi:hypothetical protein